jgi:hypothetical protein
MPMLQHLPPLGLRSEAVTAQQTLSGRATVLQVLVDAWAS